MDGLRDRHLLRSAVAQRGLKVQHPLDVRAARRVGHVVIVPITLVRASSSQSFGFLYDARAMYHVGWRKAVEGAVDKFLLDNAAFDDLDALVIRQIATFASSKIVDDQQLMAGRQQVLNQRRA